MIKYMNLYLYFREFHSYVHLCQIMHKNIIILYYILLKKKKKEKNNVISSSIHQIIHHLLPIISCHPSEKLEGKKIHELVVYMTD